MDSEWIPLRAMSARQQRLVERHLGLVYLTLVRHPQLIHRRRACREPDELFQEGCVALMKALRTHDPVLHGHFAAFAMARIHYAISHYALEHEHAVRIPYITQRRRRAELKVCPWTPATGVPLPKSVSMKDARLHAGPSLSSERFAEGSRAADAAVTLGELIRDRYDLALRQVVWEMKNAARCAANNREVVERCCEERWEIPEGEMRTSFLELARRLNCSKGRIAHCEERMRINLGKKLIADAQYQTLKRWVRILPMGLRTRFNRRDQARLALDPTDVLSGKTEQGD